MKTYSFLLNFGYVEDSGLSFTPFVSNKKFSSTKDAFIDLANFLKDAFVGEPKPKKNCCIKSVSDGLKFCGKCGKSTEEPAFNAEHYTDFVRQIDGASIDSYHSGIVEYDEEARWQTDLPENLNEAKIIYNAEWCLAAAIGHSKRSEVTVDTIFKDHRKTNSFSFYG